MKKNDGGESVEAKAVFSPDGRADRQPLRLETLVNELSVSARESLLEGYNMAELTPVFEDADLMGTADAFLYGGLNVSATARGMFMHRNTLNYRLNVIKKKTGMDIRNFETAITFKILHLLYRLK